jgi:hypothetical protein
VLLDFIPAQIIIEITEWGCRETLFLRFGIRILGVPALDPILENWALGIDFGEDIGLQEFSAGLRVGLWFLQLKFLSQVNWLRGFVQGSLCLKISAFSIDFNDML